MSFATLAKSLCLHWLSELRCFWSVSHGWNRYYIPEIVFPLCFKYLWDFFHNSVAFLIESWALENQLQERRCIYKISLLKLGSWVFPPLFSFSWELLFLLWGLRHFNYFQLSTFLVKLFSEWVFYISLDGLKLNKISEDISFLLSKWLSHVEFWTDCLP